MGTQTKTIGRMPTDQGPYDPNLAYGKKFVVTLFDCGWESKHDNNTTAPATLNSQTGTITPNNIDWKKKWGSYDQWLIDNGYKKVDAANVKDGNNTQHEINNAVANEIGTNSTPSSIKGRVTNLESAVGSGGSVDSRIATAKSEIKGNATSACDTLGEAEALISTEKTRAQAAEEQLRTLYNNLQQSQPIPVTSLPATGEAGKIYRLAGSTSYADYMYNENDLTTPIKMAEYDNAINDTPTVGSNNLVKSGGVEAAIKDIVKNLGDVLKWDLLEEISGQISNDTNPYFYFAGTYGNCTHKVIPVNPGDVIKFTGINKGAALLVLKSYTRPIPAANGRAVADVTDTVKFMSIVEGTSVTIPSDGNYVAIRYFEPIDSIPYFNPQHIFINDYDVIEGIRGLKSYFEEVLYCIDNEKGNRILSVSELPVIDGWVDGSNVFYFGNSLYGQHKVVKINKDKPFLRVKTPAAKDYFTYFVLKSYKRPTPSDNVPDFSDSFVGRQEIVGYNKIDILDLSAEDANYIAFNTHSFAGNYDCDPQEFQFFSKYEIDKLESESKWWVNDSTLHNAINQIRRRVNDTTPQADAAAYMKHPPVLSFLWFSDLHDDVPRLRRIMEFANRYPSYYDDIICTGDANDRYDNNFDYWHNLDCDKVLLSLGNHEQVYVTGEGTPERVVHRDVPQVDLYNKYFAPFVASQGVVYQQDKVYWYKDYVQSYITPEGNPTSKTIRLIQVYPTLNNASEADFTAQIVWFNNILTDAKDNGYAVIVMNHYKATPCVLINSNFTQIDGTTDGTSMTSFLTAVDTFINAGGEFVCWLAAHSHQDRLSYKEGYENQLFISINCAMRESTYADAERIEGTRSEDCFNIIGFDVDKKLVKMVRVGANVDYLLRPRNTICINYQTKEIVSQS